MNFIKQRQIKLKTRQEPVPTINLSKIDHLASKTDAKDIDLSNYKVLGRGKLTKKVTIKALSFSARAMEKIKNAGGVAKPMIVAAEAPTKEETSEEAPAE
jgi:ribosomal protein L18E